MRRLVTERRSRDIDITVGGLVPDREMRIVSVAVEQDSVEVHYRITPALPGPDDGGRPWLTWDWHGTDDLGNEYESWGGAYGTSDDGSSTIGDLTLLPAPPPAARRLAVHLAPFRRDEGDLGSASVEIPLPA